MNYQLSYLGTEGVPEIDLPSSKSISNRLLIAKALASNSFDIEGISDAEDTVSLQNALMSEHKEINVGIAGTAYRFLTAYYALKAAQDGIVLTGAERMLQRPIKALVETLQKMGAEIEYLGENGFPPIAIKGGKLKGGCYEINSSTSSQFVSALLLIGPCLEDPLELELKEDIVSRAYIDMTVAIMKQLGVEINCWDNRIKIKSDGYKCLETIVVEKDWSSAAFFYQMIVFGIDEIILKGLRADSIQGDKFLVQLYNELGVESAFTPKGLRLKRRALRITKAEFDLRNYPDLIPSLVVTAACLLDETIIMGVKTLRIKESDRIQALSNELKKLDVDIEQIDGDTIKVTKLKETSSSKVRFDVHGDHRIAMCLAPLSLLHDIEIRDFEVVGKSFPLFLSQFEKLGIKFQAI